MNIAILCNGSSDKITDRVELVSKIKEQGNHAFVAGINTGEINSYYSKENAEFIPIEASRSNTNPLVEIKSILSVRRMMSLNRIDSALVYGVKNHAAMVIGAKLGRVKRIVCIVNGSGNLFRISGVKGHILRFMSFPMLKIAYALADYVCFQNSDDKALFIKKHLVCDEKKLFLTGGSGTNLEVFPCKKLPDDNRFLFLARITPSKGINEYIKAAKIVKAKYEDAIFDIVGPLDSAIENDDNSILREACSEKIVTYHGATTDVPGWMARCRFFIYPSFYPEGVPRCAIQGIATGRPIITCDTPGCKETVIDGINGFMIPAQNHEILAEKMIWMIEHPRDVEKMAVESRKYAENKFDVHKVNELLISKLK